MIYTLYQLLPEYVLEKLCLGLFNSSMVFRTPFKGLRNLKLRVIIKIFFKKLIFIEKQYSSKITDIDVKHIKFNVLYKKLSIKNGR